MLKVSNLAWDFVSGLREEKHGYVPVYTNKSYVLIYSTVFQVRKPISVGPSSLGRSNGLHSNGRDVLVRSHTFAYGSDTPLASVRSQSSHPDNIVVVVSSFVLFNSRGELFIVRTHDVLFTVLVVLNDHSLFTLRRFIDE